MNIHRMFPNTVRGRNIYCPCEDFGRYRDGTSTDMLLRLGEHAWRACEGWPLHANTEGAKPAVDPLMSSDR